MKFALEFWNTLPEPSEETRAKVHLGATDQQSFEIDEIIIRREIIFGFFGLLIAAMDNRCVTELSAKPVKQRMKNNHCATIPSGYLGATYRTIF